MMLKSLLIILKRMSSAGWRTAGWQTLSSLTSRAIANLFRETSLERARDALREAMGDAPGRLGTNLANFLDSAAMLLLFTRAVTR